MHTIPGPHRGPASRTPFLALGILVTTGLFAQLDDQARTRLKAEIAALEERLTALENTAAPTPGANSTTPTVAVDRRGLVVQSPDEGFMIRVRPRMQVDGLWFPDDHDGSSGFTLRRVRPVIQGDAGPLSWSLMPELAGTVRLLDAWGRLTLSRDLSLQAGQFKGPVGLERLQSFSHTLFIERGLPSVLTPTREIGVQLSGDAGEGLVVGSVGVFNGVFDDTDPSSNGNLSDDLEFGGRIALRPFKNTNGSLTGLTFGAAASIGEEQATIDDTDRDRRIRYRTSGRNTFFRYADGVVADGTRRRLNAFASWYHGPFGLLTEYVQSSYRLARATHARTVETRAFTLQLGWVVTGENASFNGVRPKRPFAPSRGHWGALELGVRLHTLKVGDEAFLGTSDVRLARSNATPQARTMGFAANWVVTDNLLFALNYEVTDFSGSGANRRSEGVLQTRLQVDF